MNRRLIYAGVVGSLGGFVFGYDLGALSSATQSLRNQFHLSPAAFGLTISFSLWGTIFGSLLAGRIADAVGRRRLIAGCSILYALAAIGIAFPAPPQWGVVLAMRFLCGAAIGGFTVGCPLYLSELAPVEQRGRFVTLFQIQVSAGVVVGFSVGSLIAHLAAPDLVWKWCLGFGAIPALALLGLLPLIPQSGLERAGSSSIVEKCVGRERLFRRRNTRPILLATSIAIFNQLSGVNILLLYMLDILSSAGVGLFTGHTYTVLISCLTLATTFLGAAFVDKLGRKPLLFIGAAGMAVCLFSLGLAIPHHFAPLLYLFILIGYNVFFAFSQGTVVWVYLSELFPPGIRGTGQGYGSSVNWIVNAILIFAFPVLHRISPVRIFYFFALTMVLQIGVIWIWYPETRGIALGSFVTGQGADGDIIHHDCDEIG